VSILILAAERDITADRMVSVLKAREVPFARIDTAWFPQAASLDPEFRDGRWVGSLEAAGRRITLEGLRAVWYRSPSALRFPDELSATERHWAMGEAKLGIGGILASLSARWVNSPNRNAAYKPHQLVVAARCGLAVTDTLITNVAEAVRRFAEPGATIGKTLRRADDRGGRRAQDHVHVSGRLRGPRRFARGGTDRAPIPAVGAESVRVPGDRRRGSSVRGRDPRG
jgi:hypothetical protein